MFLTLHKDNKPVCVNMNTVFYVEPLADEKYHTMLVSSYGHAVIVDEHVDEIAMSVHPRGIRKPVKVAEDIQPFEMPVEDLYLSKRAENVLAKLKINTLGELVHNFPKSSLFVHGLGETTRAEIEAKVHACGYRFPYEEVEE